MASSPIPSKINLALGLGIVSLLVFSLIAMPLLLGPHIWWMIAVTLLLIPFNTPLWSLIHEAIHKNFHEHKKINEVMGRAMAVLFGASFGVLRFGHLMHHLYNRDWESEFYTGNKWKARAVHYFTMLGGLYLTELAMSFLIAALPLALTRKVGRRIFTDARHYQAVENSLLRPENLRKIRTDCLWIVLLYALVFMAYGAAWPVALLAVIGRAMTVSLMDNAYHYGTPRDNSVVAKELKAPKALARFILNFNYHMTHHKNVGLPWTALPARHAEQRNDYAQSLGSALAAQFKGPIKIEDNPNR